MTVLLKAGGSALPARRLTTAAPAGTAPSPAEIALEAAVAEIAALKATLAERAKHLERAVAAARREGEEVARAAAADAGDARLAALAVTATAARLQWDEKLGGLETLSVLIARTALARIVRDCGDMTDLVTRQIALRVATLRRETIVAVRVSADDFADDAALGDLVEEAGAGPLAVVADPALGSGDCRIDLTLGHIDLGVAQWDALDTFLDRLAAGSQQ